MFPIVIKENLFNFFLHIYFWSERFIILKIKKKIKKKKWRHKTSFNLRKKFKKLLTFFLFNFHTIIDLFYFKFN